MSTMKEDPSHARWITLVIVAMGLLIKEIFKAGPSGSVIIGSAIAAFIGLYLFI